MKNSLPAVLARGSELVLPETEPPEGFQVCLHQGGILRLVHIFGQFPITG